MENFVFQNSTKIIFGQGTEDQVGQETKRFAERVLFHYGGGSIKRSGLYQQVKKFLEQAGVDFVELGGVKPNPHLNMVEAGIDLCRHEDIKFILAVGGGSVIDSAKAIAAGVPYPGQVWDFFVGKETVREALPLGVVLTIPAAGSESSGGSVITKEEGKLKRSIASNLLRPRFAIMNPEITYTLSDYQTVCGVADMMAHVMERYFTRVTGVDLTDRLSEAILRTIIKTTPLVLAEPTNYPARAELMWASTVAHNGLLGTGRISDWASHQIEHELSGIYDVAHGAGLAVIFPAWMEYVCQEDLARFAQFAVRVWSVEADFRSPEKTARAGIKRLREFFASIGLPVTMAELGIGDELLEEMAEKCVQSGPVGNFKKLDKEDVLKIYQLARNTN